MSELDKIKQVLRQNKPVLKKKFKVKMLGIFGSYAKGLNKAGSDIDLLVKYGAGMTLFDDAALALFLEDKLSKHVDLVDVETLRPAFKDEVLTSLIPL